MQQIKVPMVRGAVSMRGKKEGWLYKDDAPGFAALKIALKAAAEQSGQEHTVHKLLLQVRDFFAGGQAEWESSKQDCIGHVFEAHLNGTSFLIAEERVLYRIREH